MSNQYEDADKATAKLGVANFIDDHKSEIYAKIEQYHEETLSLKPKEQDANFIAQILPLINAIIMVGSTRDRLAEAKKWVGEELRQNSANPVDVLSGLLLIEVMKKGHDEFDNSENEEMRKTWNHIYKRVKKLLD